MSNLDRLDDLFQAHHHRAFAGEVMQRNEPTPSGRPQDVDLEMLNDFINRSFRDEADRDYIAARLTYRAGLYNQFLWASLQAIEKYLKAILLYNLVPVKEIRNHDLVKLLNKVLALNPPIPFVFPKPLPDYLDYLTTYGNNRYFTKEIFLEGFEILDLDRSVWHIRRYCCCLIAPENWHYPHTREEFLKAIHHPYYEKRKHRYDLVKGFLWEVLGRKSTDPARASLVWKNLYFGSRAKKTVSHKPVSKIVLPTHVVYPEVYRVMKDLVHFTPEERTCFEARLKGTSEDSVRSD